MKKLFTLLMVVVLTIATFAGCMSRNMSQAPIGGSDANTPDTSKFIGEEKAKQIALEKAGIGSDGVVFERIELDRDNGVWQYELDFRQGRYEYDADIKADDGSVINFETDHDD